MLLYLGITTLVVFLNDIIILLDLGELKRKSLLDYTVHIHVITSM